MSAETIYVLPPSYAQQRLWLACQIDKTSSAYNIVKVIRIHGDLNPQALERSLNEVVRRHEALRTSFDEEGGQPRQVIRHAARLRIDVEQLLENTPEQRRRKAEMVASQEAGRGFDLSEWPLLRVRLLRLEQAEHLLILVMHHIISDGWSIAVLMHELGQLYDSYSRGQAPQLEELEIQYADYAQWQREWLESGELDRQMAYWREQLQGAPPVLDIPTDFVRPAQPCFDGATAPLELSPALTAQLKQLSRAEGATLFMSLMAALAVLLWRYSNQTDVVVGTPIANRSRAEVEGLIGFFVNPLVMRVRITEQESFRKLLKKVREVALGAYAHQDVPFEKLVEELHPDRDFSHSPLFQVMVAVHNQPADELKLRALKLETLASEYETSKFDLTLTLGENQHAIKGSIRYKTALFREDTIIRMARRFERLVRFMVDSPDSAVGQFDILGSEEKHQLFTEWNDTQTDFRAAPPAHRLVEAEAARNPEAIALAAASSALTYRELDKQANRLAHFLRRKGVRLETVVGVCMDRSLDLIISQLAVLKAGGAYLPIDPVYPRERIAFMLADSQAALLLTRQALEDHLLGLTAEVIAVDSLSNHLEHESAASPQAEVAPENLAYLVYTSGSTGTPKGVGVPHAALLNLIRWHNSAYEVTREDRATLLAGVSFDASVWEIWPYLAAGASIHIPDDEIRSDAGRLVPWLNRSSITKSFMATPMAEVALAQPWPETASLKMLFTGGDKLHWPSGAPLPFQLINHYGPTENAVVATCAPVTWDGSLSAPPIGRPISNTSAYVLNHTLGPAPIGVKGQLYIGGLSLARAYIGQPETTAQRFVPNPYAGRAGERLYGTGDVVRYLGDGNLEFWGRSDEQVKIRGYRIEPGEIEAALLDHSEVKAAAVTAYDLPDGQKQLVAYVVGRTASACADRDSLKDHLRKRLPSYMVPAQFVFLPALLLTPNGKLDKRRLPRHEAGAGDPSDEKFLSPVEEKLAELWAGILRLKSVGRQHNFFEIGGHSLAAMQLVAKVRELFGVDLNIRHIFEEPTIPGLAGLIAKKSSEERGKSIPKISRAGARRGLPKLE